MNPYEELAKEFRQIAEKAASEDAEIGNLGFLNSDGNYTIESENPGFLWVRIQRGGSISAVEAFNGGVPAMPDYPVRVIRHKNLLLALPDFENLLNYFAGRGGFPFSPVGIHTHEPQGGNFDWVSTIRIKAGLVFVSSGLEVEILKFYYIKPDNTLGLKESEVVDMASYLPSSGLQCWAVVGLNTATETIEVRTTTPEAIGPDLVIGSLDGLDLETFQPHMGIRLINGATAFTFADFEDVRLWTSRGIDLGAISADSIGYGSYYSGYWSPYPEDLSAAVDQLIYRVEILENQAGSGNAVDVDYDPADSTDWSPTPSNVAGALDTLADVVKSLEGGSGSVNNYASRIYRMRTFF